MKKMLSLVLALLMVLSLTACGGGTAPNGTSSDGNANYNSTPVLTIALSKKDYSGDAMIYLGKILKERSEGRLNPTVYKDIRNGYGIYFR